VGVGVYTVTEGTQAGWTLTSSNNQVATVDNNNPVGTVNFVNRIAGAVGNLAIHKTTTGGNGTFTFSVTGPNAYSSTQTITTVNGTGSVTVSGVDAGTYTVTENTQSGWTLTSSNGPTATVTAGGTGTVNFANKAIGNLTAHTIATGGNVTFTFSVTGPNAYASTQTITTVNGTGSVTVSGVDAG